MYALHTFAHKTTINEILDSLIGVMASVVEPELLIALGAYDTIALNFHSRYQYEFVDD